MAAALGDILLVLLSAGPRNARELQQSYPDVLGDSPVVDGLHIAVGAGVVPRRVAELLKPRARRYPAMLRLLPVALAVASIAWTGEATYDLIELLRAARVR